MVNDNYSEGSYAWVFLIIPTLFIIFGLWFFKYPLQSEIIPLLPISLFLGLILLGFGSFIKKKKLSNYLKILGWFTFSFYWSTKTGLKPPVLLSTRPTHSAALRICLAIFGRSFGRQLLTFFLPISYPFLPSDKDDWVK